MRDLWEQLNKEREEKILHEEEKNRIVD